MLSRACLGKSIVFMWKWRKKGGFPHRVPGGFPQVSREDQGARECRPHREHAALFSERLCAALECPRTVTHLQEIRVRKRPWPRQRTLRRQRCQIQTVRPHVKAAAGEITPRPAETCVSFSTLPMSVPTEPVLANTRFKTLQNGAKRRSRTATCWPQSRSRT